MTCLKPNASERGHYASVNEQLNAIGDDIWDRATISTVLKSWAGALHPDSQWSNDLKPARGSSGKPAVSLAPALILRKRTQAGMVRIYDSIINRLTASSVWFPPGWSGLIEDTDDTDSPENLGRVRHTYDSIGSTPRKFTFRCLRTENSGVSSRPSISGTVCWFKALRARERAIPSPT